MIEILKLKGNEGIDLLEGLLNDSSLNEITIQNEVKEIIENIKTYRDEALKKYTTKFDKVDLKSFEVNDEEFLEAFKLVDKDLVEILNECKSNIEDYHNKQLSQGYIYKKDLGVLMGQRVLPLSRVGVYVPGGTAAYPSSVLMNVIPAKIAGVKDVIMVTPPSKNGEIDKNILVAAKIAGVDKVYKIGGAQAIAALAYGTETIMKVEKIVGPGNAYVAEAKRVVFGDVGIDMVAGPSEIAIIADKDTNPKYIAADLMSQAEHDTLARAILITTSEELAVKVIEEIKLQINYLSRKDIIQESLKQNGKIIICNDIEECIKTSNYIAPEHLQINTKNPMELLEKIKNAGSVFLGEFTPEAVGDYFAGTNHVLPTRGTARFTSPLGVDTFVKKSSFIYYSMEALIKDGKKIIKIAEEEGLSAHGNSVKVRLVNEGY